MCSRCTPLDDKLITTIFDVNQLLAFTRILGRILPDIEANQTKVAAAILLLDNNNDVMINEIYKALKNKIDSTPFVSILLHLDGISQVSSRYGC